MMICRIFNAAKMVIFVFVAHLNVSCCLKGGSGKRCSGFKCEEKHRSQGFVEEYVFGEGYFFRLLVVLLTITTSCLFVDA